jgi:hypothetical protein
MITYTPHNWYWRKADGTIFSSAAQGVVPADDPAYVAFQAAGGTPTPYPKDESGQESEAELAAVLAPYGLHVSQDAARREEIRARFDKIDQERSRALSDIALKQYVDFAMQKLTALEAERAALAEELAGLAQAG